jgi:DNA polymerase
VALSWVVLDFETISGLDVTDVGAWRYAEDPSTEIVCCCYSHGGVGAQTWTPDDPGRGLVEFARDDSCTFIAFNVQFEKAIWRHIMVPQFGFSDVPNERWHDVQAVAAMKVVPQSLDKLASVLKFTHQKGDFRAQDMSKFNKKTGQSLLTPEVREKCYSYCKQDIRAEVEGHDRLGFLPRGERKVWLLNQRVNERGIRLDLTYIEKCQEVVQRASIPLVARFRDLTGLKPSQGEKFKDWIRAQGVEGLDSLAKGLLTEALSDDEEIPGTLFTGGMDFPGPVREALEIRQTIGHESIKKLQRMVDCVSADGRSRGLLQYHGTGPGRSAGRLWQPHNLPKPTFKYEMNALVDALMTGDPQWVEDVIGKPAIECVAAGLRHALVSDPGRVFMSADYAGIQARLVLALAGQMDKAAMLAAGKDVYADMAQAIYRRPIDKEKDPVERQIGKNCVLGLGFQMGAGTFQGKMARDRDIPFCQSCVTAYRKEWAPKVPYVWYGLEDAAAATVHTGRPHEAYGILYAIKDQWLTARLPSGRLMWYYNPQPTRRQAPWDPKELKNGFTYQATKMGQFKTIDAFGGQLTENVIMGMERDIMTKAQLTCEANGLPVVLEVHDEVVVEPLAKDADEKAFHQIMLDTDDWVRSIQVPIAVEGWVGDRYRK